MDGRNPAPQKKPGMMTWFAMVSKWCEMDVVHPQYGGGPLRGQSYLSCSLLLQRRRFAQDRHDQRPPAAHHAEISDGGLRGSHVRRDSVLRYLRTMDGSCLVAPSHWVP